MRWILLLSALLAGAALSLVGCAAGSKVSVGASAPLTITSQPESQTIPIGASATFVNDTYL